MLKLKLNPALGVPIYRQIMEGIKEMVATQILKPGDRLPSIRELSGTLKINPSSAVKAYNELKHAGIIELDQGRGTFVSRNPKLHAKSREELLTNDLRQLLDKAESRGFSDREVLKELKAMITQRGKSS